MKNTDTITRKVGSRVKGQLFIFPLLFLGLYVSSCKSGEIYDDREILIGSWQWDNSYHLVACGPYSRDTITSSSMSDAFGIEISKKEKFYLAKNGEVQSESPVFINVFRESDYFQRGYFFSIYFAEDFSDEIQGHVSRDSILLNSFWPEDFVDDACNSYINFFVKAQ